MKIWLVERQRKQLLSVGILNECLNDAVDDILDPGNLGGAASLSKAEKKDLKKRN